MTAHMVITCDDWNSLRQPQRCRAFISVSLAHGIAEARERGWQLTATGDYCPSHRRTD